MPYRKTDVRVMDGAAVIETVRDRPVRRLPDGLSGVVYGGRVYALHPGSTGTPEIVLSETPWSKGECATFVSTDEAMLFRQAPSGTPGLVLTRWAIETTRYGHYVVVDADEPQVERLVTLLEADGIPVRRWDASYRPAADGHFYDWFLRLDFDGDHEECEDAVASVIDGTGADVANLNARLEELTASLDRLEREVAQSVAAKLEQQREEANRELTASRVELEEERRRRREAEAAARDLKAALAAERAGRTTAERELADLRASSGRVADDERDAELDDLRAKLMAAARLADERATDIHELQDLADAYARDADEHRAEVGALRERLVEAEEASRAANARSSRTAPRGRDDILSERIWDRIVLHETAVAAIHDPEEFALLSDLFRVLRLIDSGERVAWRPWPGGVIREVDDHVRTGVKGCEDMGRVYFADLPAGRRLVFVHRKRDENQQKRFVERSANQVTSYLR